MGYKIRAHYRKAGMESTRDILYIRAVDLRPLFIKFTGVYHPITRIFRPVTRDRMEEHTGYELRLGDLVEIYALKRYIKVEIGHDTELTDEPKLAKRGYPFA